MDGHETSSEPVGFNRLGEGEGAAGVGDVEVLDHPAVDGDDAAALGLGRGVGVDHPPGPARPPRRSATTRRWPARPGSGGRASCRRSPSRRPGGTRRRSPRRRARRCRRRRARPCRPRGRRARPSPGTAAGCRARRSAAPAVSLARSLVPSTSTSTRAWAASWRTSKIAVGVSTIAQIDVAAAPAASRRGGDVVEVGRRVDLRDDDGRRRGGAGRGEVVGAPRRRQPVAADRQLAVAVLARRDRGDGLLAGQRLGVGRHGVLEVEDDGVARDLLGLLQRPGVRRRHVQHRPPRPFGHSRRQPVGRGQLGIAGGELARPARRRPCTA